MVPAVLWWQPEGGAARVVAGAKDAYPATVFEQVNPSMGTWSGPMPLSGLAIPMAAMCGICTRGLVKARRHCSRQEHRWRVLKSILVLFGSAKFGLERVNLKPDAVLPKTVSCRVGRVEELVGRLQRPDLVLANPPRTGMDSRVLDGILAAAPRTVAYISCDPATLARDIARLNPRYQVTVVQSFDLFPRQPMSKL